MTRQTLDDPTVGADSRQELEQIAWAALAERAPAEVAALLSGGRCSLSQGDHVTAELAFREALRIAPLSSGAQACMAELLVREGRPALACQFLREACTNDPDNRLIRAALLRTLRLADRVAAEASDPSPTPMRIELAGSGWPTTEPVTRIRDLAGFAAASALSEAPPNHETATQTPPKKRRRGAWLAAGAGTISVGVLAAVGLWLAPSEPGGRALKANELLSSASLLVLQGESATKVAGLLREAQHHGAASAGVARVQTLHRLAFSVMEGRADDQLAAELTRLGHPNKQAEPSGASVEWCQGCSALRSYLEAELERRAGVAGSAAAIARIADEDTAFAAPRLSLLWLRALAAPERAQQAAARLADAHPANERLALFEEALRALSGDPSQGPKASASQAPVDRFLWHLANAARASNQERDVHTSLSEALNVGLRDPEALGLLVLIASGKGQFDVAVEAARRLQDYEPRESYLALLTQAVVRRGDGVTALALAGTRCADSPGLAASIVRAALIATDRASLTRCAAELLAGLSTPQAGIDQGSASALNAWLASDEAPEQRLETIERIADQLLEQAASAAPPADEVRQLLAEASARPSRDGPSSAQELEAGRLLLQEQPGRLDVRLQVAVGLMARGELAAAEVALGEVERAASSLPGSLAYQQARAYRVRVLLELAHLPAAKTAFEALRDELPATLALELAARLALAEDPKRALSMTGGVRGMTAELAAIRGEAQLALGYFSLAVRSFTAALRTSSPADRAAYRVGLGEALLQQGQVLAAHYQLERAHTELSQRQYQGPALGRALLLDGKALLHAGPPLPARALARLTAAAQTNPAPEVHFWIAVAHNLLRAGAERQRESLLTYLALQPNGPLAARARRLLNLIGPE